MAFKQTTNSKTTQPPKESQKLKPGGDTEDSIQGPTAIDLESLTPLQRQRLDAAVMMLVEYLLSVSSET